MMTTIIYNMAVLIGFFVNLFATLALGYQQFAGGLDDEHKALFALVAFNLIFFASVLIVH